MRLTHCLSPVIAVLLLVLAGTTAAGGAKRTGTALLAQDQKLGTCPGQLSENPNCFTPHDLRLAYDLDTLTQHGFTGKGQTVIDVVSFGSPTLQQDMDTFDRQFGLPPLTIQVIAPLGTVPFDPKNKDMVGWAGETELDVEIIHAIAPDAGIVVLSSPVSETEGTVGLPEFLKLEQYAIAHHLGQILSQSWGASEATLRDSAGQGLVKRFTDFYREQTRQGVTFLTGSGDNGATDFVNVGATKLSRTPIVNFPADVPWVTAVGGTTLRRTAAGFSERAWSGSGGGVSAFFAEPVFQRGLPARVQSFLAGRRGLPDIAADADPRSGMAFYLQGQWIEAGGTSASAPFWAALIAIANQMAGRPLGFINPGLYQLGNSPQAVLDYRDVTSGNNSYNHGKLHVKGYEAGPGWDPVTGWGGPRAGRFIPDLIAALK